MTEAMPFLQKAILLSYDPRPFAEERFFVVMGESVGLEGALRQTERYQLVNLK